MSLRSNNDGSPLIESGIEFQEAVELLEEHEAQLKEIEQHMEDEFDYLTMRQETGELKEAIRVWMTDNDQANIQRPDYKLTLVRSAISKWNETKLREIVGKSVWLRITKTVVDPDKIDDLVRAGKLDRAKISSALETRPKKTFLRWSYNNEQDADEEEARVREAMSG